MITAVILTKNEEKNIVDCLESLAFCNEVVVIDDDSTDRTVEIAKNRGAKVINRKLKENFSEQRNYALSLVKNGWVLFIDADERVSTKLAKEILDIINNSQHNGFYIKRTDQLFGKELEHGELANKKFIRLGKKEKGKWEGLVHEEWKIQGSIGILKNSIIHFPHPSLTEFISEINFYTTIRAHELYKKGVRASWYSIIFYTKAKFIQTYVFKLGFLDGMPGFILSLIMSLHSFLVRAKLYLLSKK